MQKWTSAMLGAMVIITTGVIVLRVGPRAHSGETSSASVQVPAPLPIPATSSTAKVTLDALAPGMPGTRLLDGTEPPALPSNTPKSMRFGVVLVQYRGAQRATVDTRSKSEALALASALAEIGKRDFRAAVDKGDPGSMEDAGTMPQGVLEPAPNYVLFSLSEGAVGGPVDTPTGYWVMKNLSK
jgi:hypothetical protein